MPREIITIQVGQCGNQIGARFWDLLLQEHGKFNKKPNFDEAMSSFFRNVDPYSGTTIPINAQKGYSPIESLRARAVIVDTETGVTNQLLKSDLGELFDARQFITDVSGAGNNWAHGFSYYGPKYKDDIIERIRKTAEECSSLQSFFLVHSLGGGTGSGLGTYILSQQEDYFPEVFRFTTSIFPSGDDDVVTSPYNSVLALNQLIQHSDCVLPVDNEALMRMATKCTDTHEKQDKMGEDGEKKKKPFDTMNSQVAHLQSNLTSSMRFHGQLNIDLNEVTMNLVPFPRLHFQLPSIAPIYSIVKSKLPPRPLDQMFSDVLMPEFQLLNCNPKQNRYLAVGLIIRGDVAFSDVSRNIEKMKKKIDLISWNSEGFKYGICDNPTLNYSRALLCLANNTAINEVFNVMSTRFNKLYKRKVYVHHYTEYTEKAIFDEAQENQFDIIHQYLEINKQQPEKEQYRYKPLF